MSQRRKGRESALQILYQAEMHATSNDKAFVDLNKTELDNAIEHFFNHFDAVPEVYNHASSLVRGTHLNLGRIDALLQSHSPNWKLERMGSVDRNVLRLATYELLFLDDLSANIVIDEAIEIARKFGNEKSAAFVNGLLDSVAKEVRKSH